MNTRLQIASAISIRYSSIKNHFVYYGSSHRPQPDSRFLRERFCEFLLKSWGKARFLSVAFTHFGQNG